MEVPPATSRRRGPGATGPTTRRRACPTSGRRSRRPARPNDTVETSVTVEWRNELDNAFLPNDPTIIGRRHARRAGADRHAPARRREPSAVRRDAAAVVHEGRREGPALHHEHVHVLQRAAREHGLVSRPRARQHAHERLRGARRRSTSSATTRTRARPAIRSVCPPARTRSRSCCRTRRSTPTAACSTRREGVTAYHPRVGAGVLRRRRGRERQDLALRGRRAAPLPASGSSTDRSRASTTCSSPTRRAAGRCRSRRSGPTAGCCARPCR